MLRVDLAAEESVMAVAVEVAIVFPAAEDSAQIVWAAAALAAAEEWPRTVRMAALLPAVDGLVR